MFKDKVEITGFNEEKSKLDSALKFWVIRHVRERLLLNLRAKDVALGY